MSLRPKPEIENLNTGTHGGIDYAELASLGINPEKVLDFSVCTNPFMQLPTIASILKSIDIGRYPDSATTELRQRLSAKLGISPDNILAGNGSTELIRIAAQTYFEREDPVLILEPTYGDYEVACSIVGAKPVKQRARAEDGFIPDIAETVHLIKQHHPRGVFICNPNNPTGKYLPRRDIETIQEAIPDGLLILDEAYVNFVEKSWSSLELSSRGNVIVLRSLTKDYALAGLRIGYAIASRDIISSMRRVCPPWHVNIIAQKAGTAALENEACLQDAKRKLKEAKQFLVDSFSQRGFPVLPSDTHYFLVKAGAAGKLRSVLLRHGILVRDCASFGLPEYVRISPRSMDECRQFVNILDSVLKKKGNTGN